MSSSSNEESLDPTEASIKDMLKSTGSGSSAPKKTRRLRKSGRLGTTSSSRLKATSASESQRLRAFKGRRPGSSVSSSSSRTGRRAEVPQPVDSDDPLVGSTVEGKYRILEPIGQGGMASVYRAWHLLLEKEMAIKFIVPEATESVNFRERFFREARIASELIHRNLVQTRDFGETVDGQFFMLMDYCQGRSLGAIIAQDGPMAPDRAGRIVAQILDALGEAHRLAIVHRDIKPDNVVVDEEADDHVKVLDFGLAKIIEPDPETGELQNLTRQGAVLGTPKYMSPEQALGQECDDRSDLYSTGLVLYELLCGQLPFKASTSSEMIRKQIVEVPAPPSQAVPGLDIPEVIESIVMKAITKEKENRWQTAREFKDVIDEFCRGGYVDATLPTTADAFEHRGNLKLSSTGEGVEVHRVRHKEHGTEGLSWILSSAKARRDTVATFTNQLDLVKRIQHPALANLVEAGAYVGERLYAFTCVGAGSPLSERIAQGQATEAEVIGVAGPLLAGLAKAHDLGVTHLAVESRLVNLGDEGPCLAGLGVVPAGRGRPGDPKQDVRGVGMLCLELLAGAHAHEVGADTVKASGMKRATGGFRAALEKATGDTPHPSAGALLKALQLSDSRFAARQGGSPKGLLAAVAAALLAVGLFLGYPAVKAALTPRGTLSLATAPEAKVEVTGTGALAQGEQHAPAFCDAKGSGRFEDLPAGTYRVEVSKPGFRPTSQAVTVAPGQVTQLDVALERDAPKQLSAADLDKAVAAKLEAMGLKAAKLSVAEALGEAPANTREALEALLGSAPEQLAPELKKRLRSAQDQLKALDAQRKGLGEEAAAEDAEGLADAFEDLAGDLARARADVDAWKAKLKTCDEAMARASSSRARLKGLDLAEFPGVSPLRERARATWDSARERRTRGDLGEATARFMQAQVEFSQVKLAHDMAESSNAKNEELIAQLEQEKLKLKKQAAKAERETRAAQRRAGEERQARLAAKAKADEKEREASRAKTLARQKGEEAERQRLASLKATKEATEARRREQEAKTEVEREKAAGLAAEKEKAAALAKERKEVAAREAEREKTAAAQAEARATRKPARSRKRKRKRSFPPSTGVLEGGTFVALADAILVRSLRGEFKRGLRVLLLHTNDTDSTNMAWGLAGALKKDIGATARVEVYSSQAELRESCERIGPNVIFLSKGLKGEVAEITKVTRALDILSLCASSSYVKAGVSMGLALRNHNTQLYLNLSAARAESVAIPRKVRKLSLYVD